MTINGRELMSVVVDICRKRNAKECITSSLKGGLLAGGACALGGLILGPVGLALGGALGGGLAAASSDFKPLPVVISQDLTDAEKNELLSRVSRVLLQLGPQDALTISMLMLAPNEELILQAVRLFFSEVRHTQISFDQPNQLR
ncbi:unnamed protein product [Bemisia tabaci]|uniref:Uncharacterized protein n=1 Tax=Bemisia tabaci TaxID=7038 RepID=A0A9P0A6N2_BEMTA|nr:PREDICTED: protein C19orf12-like [Bemisia tabaci]XP_018913876.1 PREDICTED: protein C19orf12-like [Bemisia tabaci]CAH0385711.1 unnamed protein product [Bemisia tabaci]